MLKFLRTFAMAAAMLLPFAAGAQTLTVADGTEQTQGLPFDGFNADNAQHNQILYLATDLEGIPVGADITQLVFYFTNPGNNHNAGRLGSWTISIGETTATTLSSLDNSTATTQVASAVIDPDYTANTWTVEFDNPYSYQGGNLLIDINHAAASWNRLYFLGISRSNCGVKNSTAQNTLPKCTFSYEIPSNCKRVQNLTATDVTYNSLTLTWQDTINPAGATYKVMQGETVLAESVSSTSYAVTGLSDITDYTFSVITNCADQTVSGAANLSIKTPCGPVPLPYTCGFEDSEVEAYNGNSSYMMPTCWERLNVGGTSNNNYPYAYNYSYYAHTGSRSLYFYMSYVASYGDTVMAILPAIDPAVDPMGNNMIRFWAHSNTAYDVEVGYITDITDASTFVATDTVSLAGNSSYAEYEALLLGAPATANRAALRLLKTQNTSASIYIDDVVLEHQPTCIKLQDLTALATSSSITLTWEDAANTGATYSVMMKQGNDSTYTTVQDTTVTFNNLPEYTNYTFGVRAVCSADDSSRRATIATRTLRAGHEVSAFTVSGTLKRGDLVFDTNNRAVTVPVWYTDNLNSGLSFSWTLSTGAYPYIDTTGDGSYTCQIYTSSIKNYLQMNTPMTIRVKAEDTTLYSDYTLTLVTEECVADRNLQFATERIRYTATWDNPDTTVTTHYFINSPVRLSATDLATAQYITVTGAREYTVEGLSRDTKYYVYLKSACSTEWLEDSVRTRPLGGEESVIVADGTTTNNYLPIYGSYMDDPIACQSIYPATMLTELVGKSVTRLHYFVYSGSGNAWNDNKPMTVKVKVVDNTTLSAFDNMEGSVTVYDGLCIGSAVSVANGFDIVFSEPLTYTGGNLLISLQANPNDAGGYNNVYFYGSSASYGSSRYGYGSGCYNLTSGGTSQSFLPKVEVFYDTPANACPEVTAISADSITNTYARINWTSADADYCVGNQIIVSATALDESGLESATPVALAATAVSYEATGLTPDHDYFVYVRALCNGTEHPEGTSGWAEYQFRTFPNVRTPEIMWAEVRGKHTALVAVMNTGLDLGQATNYDYIASTTLLDATALASATPTATAIDTMLVEIANLASETKYFFYFRNVMGNEVSPWSAPDSVVMPAQMPAVIDLTTDNVAHNAMTAYWYSDVQNFADETAWRAAIVLHGQQPAADDWQTVTDTLTAHVGYTLFLGLLPDTAYDIYVCAYDQANGMTSDTTVLQSVRTATFPSACQTIGEGTGNQKHMLPGWYGYHYVANLYELSQTGSIESIAFDLTSGSTSPGSTMKVWVKEVPASYVLGADTTFSSMTTGATLIYDGTADFTTAQAGWVSLPISTPIAVNGGNQLLVMFRGEGCSTSGGCGKDVHYTNTPGTYTHWYALKDTEDPGMSTNAANSSLGIKGVNGQRENLQLCYIRENNCLAVSTIYNLGLTDTTADLSWYPGNEESSWQYVLSTTDTLNATQLESAAVALTTPSIHLTGLVHDTTYFFYIRPVCSDTQHGQWSRRSFSTPHVDFYDINVVVNDTLMGTVASATGVRQGTEATLTAVANDGYEFYKWTFGDSTVYAADTLTLTADSNMTVYAYFRHFEATIAASEVTYWTGTGANQAVLAVNWADTALAWGVRFSAATITVHDALDTIAAADPRFSYTLDSYGYLSDILFAENGDTLRKVATSYWESKQNGVADGGMSTPLSNGDFEKWATPEAGFAYDSSYYEGWGWSYLYTYPMTIHAVTAPVITPDVDSILVTYTVNDTSMGTISPNGTTRQAVGSTLSATATAHDGYRIHGWGFTIMVGTQVISDTVYITSQSSVNFGTIPQVLADNNATVTVTAIFEASAPDSVEVTYTVNNATMGSINPNGTNMVAVGDTLSATATANDGYHIHGWGFTIMVGTQVISDTVYITSQSSVNFGTIPQVFADYNATVTITAIFEVGAPDSVEVTYTVNDATMGSINPNGTNMVAVGDQLSATATANEGYELYAWVLTVMMNNQVAGSDTLESSETSMTFGTLPQTFANNGATVIITALFRPSVGIEDAELSNVNVYSANSTIYVRGAEGKSVYVFDINGRMLNHEAKASENCDFRMENTGVYLVKVGNAAAQRVLVVR